jgi:hypothetical protein
MAPAQIILITIASLHALLAIVVSIRVIKTKLLTPSQKRYNIILSLLVPFIWSVLMYYMLKKEPIVFDEDKQHERTSHDFHESGKAFLSH